MDNEHQCHTHEHSHHDHIHTHEHCHEGDHHNHAHDILSGEGTKEEKTLKILLGHWIEHNKSHEEGFSEWMNKARDMGKVETSQFIQKAVEFMKQADDMLKKAEEHM
ncbi:zinc transporter [Clostridium sp. Mt-5]|uniref:Zinc transporter n=1 Tax=Clostridium moutaii TaxID=3240932 RepID=A0ABV4BSK4_9CLOT